MMHFSGDICIFLVLTTTFHSDQPKIQLLATLHTSEGTAARDYLGRQPSLSATPPSPGSPYPPPSFGDGGGSEQARFQPVSCVSSASQDPPGATQERSDHAYVNAIPHCKFVTRIFPIFKG